MTRISSIRISILTPLLALVSACAGSAGPSEGPPAGAAAAPWDAQALAPSAVSPIYREEWLKAENRTSCALIGFDPSVTAGATARAAYFSGGWAVAFDTGIRSDFGVAGTGVESTPDTYDGWDNHIEWADGSRVGYGLEGGTGPNYLAYLTIAGQRCLYNVWSTRGQEHLETLLSSLRYVAAS